MKFKVLLLLIFLGNASFGQTEKMIWNDEFNGNGLPDKAKWSYNLGASGWGNNEVQDYTDKFENSRQENGVLIIEAAKNEGKWTSARLVTEGKFDFKYGRIIFRAKLPAGSGTWPALWLLGADCENIGWPQCGEIDIMEHIGRRPEVVQCALHTPASHGNTEFVGYTKVEDFNKEFHLYEANWTPDKIEFSVDGNIFYTYEPAIKEKDNWPFDHPFSIIMNIAMGGNLGSDPKFESNDKRNGIDPSLTSVRMEVDYIRVYQSDGNH